MRQYKPKKIKQYFCDGKFKPGFFEQAKYFFENITSKKTIKKHACLEDCFSVTQLIENFNR